MSDRKIVLHCDTVELLLRGVKTKAPRGRGVIAKIKALFDSGVHTVGDMIPAMEKTGIAFSPKTVRTTVTVFRRRAGISRPLKASVK